MNRSCFPLKPHDFTIYNMSPTQLHVYICLFFSLVEIPCLDLNDFHIRM